MDYTGLDAALRGLLVIPANDPNWANIFPSVIDYAEGRIYKKMNFLGIRKSDTTKAFVANTRALAMPATMIICEEVAFDDGNGNKTPLLPVSLEFINNIWPQQAQTGAMQYWGHQDDKNIVVAGTPAANYPAIFTGKFRPVAMSNANKNTYIGDNHPELMVAACMVYATGYQRDFGAQASNPQMGVSWEMQYQTLEAAALLEEQRKLTAGKPAAQG